MPIEEPFPCFISFLTSRWWTTTSYILRCYMHRFYNIYVVVYLYKVVSSDLLPLTTNYSSLEVIKNNVTGVTIISPPLPFSMCSWSDGTETHFYFWPDSRGCESSFIPREQSRRSRLTASVLHSLFSSLFSVSRLMNGKKVRRYTAFQIQLYPSFARTSRQYSRLI